MNRKKQLFYLTFLSIFCTTNIFTGDTTATSPKSTSELSTTQQKQKNGLLNKFAALPRCPYSNMPLKKLKLEQLEEVYAYTQKHKVDAALLVELLTRLIALSDNHAGVKQYKLQLADTHFSMNHIEIAATFYEDFAIMYPSSNETEYALYKAVLCMFQVSLAPDKDQTNTKKTISLVKDFLKKVKSAQLKSEAEQIMQTCNDRLYEHEVYVFNFYLKKKNFTASRMRLDYIDKTFPDLIKNFDTKVADLHTSLEKAMEPVLPPSKTSLVRKFLA